MSEHAPEAPAQDAPDTDDTAELDGLAEDTTAGHAEPDNESPDPLDGPDGEDVELPADVTAARKLRSEAKNLRTRVKAAEAERDTARDTVAGLQRQIAESFLEVTAVTPEALWASGATVAALLDEDGTVSQEAVLEAADAAVRKLGLRRVPAPNRAQGSSASGAPGRAEPSWQDLFSNGGQR